MKRGLLRRLAGRERGAGPLNTSSGRMRSRLLLVDPFVCLLRADHPVGVLTLEAYLGLGHVLVTPRGLPGGAVDDVLAARGLARTVVVQVQNFSVAPLVIARTDLVTTLPQTVAERAAETFGLRVVPVPLDLAPTRVHAAWHERWHHDPGHRWLREAVADVIAARTVSPTPTPPAASTRGP